MRGAGAAAPMAESVGMTRDETAALYVSIVLLAGSVLLVFVQLPDVLAGTTEFSPWIYVPGLLAFFVAAWKRQDHVVWLTIAWMSIYFMIDVYYGNSLFV